MRAAVLGLAVMLGSCRSAADVFPPVGDAGADSVALTSFQRRLSDAATHRDRAMMNTLLADDWTITLANGERSDKARALARWTAPLAATLLCDTSVVHSVVVLRVGAAVLTAAITDIEVRAEGADTTRTRVTDVVVRRSGQWQAIVSHESVRRSGRP